MALLSLRALAEYDPVELRRNTDLSKRQIDERVESLIEELDGSPDADELNYEMDQLHSVEMNSKSPVAAAFLLRQISSTCLQRAQISAVNYHGSPESFPSARSVAFNHESVVDTLCSPIHEEYVRLAAMRLLRKLPKYDALFEYLWNDHRIDCVLQPRGGDGPAVLIEFKSQIETQRHLQNAFKQLKRQAVGWPKSTLLAVITGMVGTTKVQDEVPSQSKPTNTPRRGRPFLLIYDPEKNEFSQESAFELLDTIQRQV